jgi:hypothetical protein
VRPFLAHAGGGEVHGDPALGVLEAGVSHGGANAIGGLAHRTVGQADGRGVGQTGRDVDLDVDHQRVHAAQGAGADAREHDLARAGLVEAAQSLGAQ